jgi:ubiquinone/menaquinone biosynthesis C-methylase UbiE
LKRGNYGLDAPTLVVGYLICGGLFEFSGLSSCTKFDYANWFINLGILFLLIGFYMVYSSKIGKYKMREKLISTLSISGDEIAIDVGCGRGLMLNGVASKITTGKVYGVDIWSARDQSGNNSNAVMKNAELEGTTSKIEVMSSDMRTLPFEDGFFDLVVSSLAIHNLSNSNERKKALFEIARVTKAGGQLALLDLAHTNDYAVTLKEQGFMILDISKPQFQMFPPVKILYAKKTL